MKKKVENGGYFRLQLFFSLANWLDPGPGFGEFRTDYESIFERMSRAVGRGGPGSIRSAVVDHGNPAVMHGAKANTSVSCTSDEEVLEGLSQVIPGHEFSFGRFTALADALGCKYRFRTI
jgi:RNA exonuclease 1